MTNLINRMAGAFLVIFAAMSLSACGTVANMTMIDPYKGKLDRFYVTVGDQVLDPPLMEYQDGVKKRCKLVAAEIVPSRGEMALASGWNNGIGGLAGGTVGSALNSAANGIPVTAETSIAGGLYYGAAGTVMGAVNGVQSSDQQRYAYDMYCQVADAGGYHLIPPSEAQAILDGKMAPKAYGPPIAGQSPPPKPPGM